VESNHWPRAYEPVLNLQKPFGLLCKIIHTTSLVTTLSQAMLSHLDSFRETKKRVNSEYLKKDKYVLKRILNALYQSYYSIPKTEVSISLTVQHYSGTELNYRTIKRIYDCLITNRYIAYQKGSKQTSKITRINPSKKLIIAFKKIGFIWRKYELNPNENNVIVKIKDKQSKKKKIIPTPDNNLSKKLQNNLNYINQKLSNHCLTLDIDDDAYLLLENEIKKHNRKNKHSDYWKENIPYSINYSKFKLDNNVNIYNIKKKFALKTEKLSGMFDTGDMYTNSPVKIKIRNSKIQGSSLSLKNYGEYIKVFGKAKLTIDWYENKKK